MLRWLLVTLAVAFGVHHTALAAAAPAAAHAHHGACAECGTTHAGHDGDAAGDVLAACAALLATVLAVPRLRRQLLRLPVRTVRPASAAEPGHPLATRPPPRHPEPVRLCVLRC